MNKEEKIKILIDWIKNLDDEALDALIEEFITE